MSNQTNHNGMRNFINYMMGYDNPTSEPEVSDPPPNRPPAALPYNGSPRPDGVYEKHRAHFDNCSWEEYVESLRSSYRSRARRSPLANLEIAVSGSHPCTLLESKPPKIDSQKSIANEPTINPNASFTEYPMEAPLPNSFCSVPFFTTPSSFTSFAAHPSAAPPPPTSLTCSSSFSPSPASPIVNFSPAHSPPDDPENHSLNGTIGESQVSKRAQLRSKFQKLINKFHQNNDSQDDNCSLADNESLVETHCETASIYSLPDNSSLYSLPESCPSLSPDSSLASLSPSLHQEEPYRSSFRKLRREGTSNKKVRFLLYDENIEGTSNQPTLVNARDDNSSEAWVDPDAEERDFEKLLAISIQSSVSGVVAAFMYKDAEAAIPRKPSKAIVSAESLPLSESVLWLWPESQYAVKVEPGHKVESLISPTTSALTIPVIETPTAVTADAYRYWKNLKPHFSPKATLGATIIGLAMILLTTCCLYASFNPSFRSDPLILHVPLTLPPLPQSGFSTSAYIAKCPLYTMNSPMLCR